MPPTARHQDRPQDRGCGPKPTSRTYAFHTYASIGVNSGQSLSVVGKLLGHSKILTTQRYAHLADDPVRTANEQIGATIEASLSGQAKAEVVKMGERKSA